MTGFGLKPFLSKDSSATRGGKTSSNPPAQDTTDDAEGDGDDDDEEDEDGDTSDADPIVFDAKQQAYINNLLKGVREEGRKAGRQKTLKELGVDNLDDAKQAVSAKKAAEDAEKTELERLTDRMTALETASQETVSSLTSALVRTEIRALAAEAGLDAEAIIGVLESVGSLDRFEFDTETKQVKGLAEAVGKLKLLAGKSDDNEGGVKFPKQSPADRKKGKEKPAKTAARDFIKKTYPSAVKE